VFDGGSLVMNRHGNVVLELDYFSPDFRIIDTELIDIAPAVAFDKECFTDKEGRIGLIKKALMLGIQDFFRKSGFSKAVLGLSGGVDSALVYALAIEALGKENVLGVLMPSPYSSGHSVNDALQLAENLGGATETVPINGPFEAFLTSLSGPFHGLPADITEENIQARIRAVLLMAYSNKKGYILLNTSNKSEAAVGYGTLYGDMAGSLSVIGDLYKTQVYELCRYLNREKEIIPENILCKEPSAELRPGQKDSDSLPPYDLLDQILYQYIELKQGPEAIAEKGFDPQLVKRVLALVNKNEFKRFQSPPVLRVSGKSFGIGRRMPLVGKYLTQ
jgi:NAD+ synthase (glutamine-hydrolysing)